MPFYIKFIKDELQEDNLPIKTALASSVHTLIVPGLLSIEPTLDNELQIKTDMIETYASFLKQTYRGILNELIE